MGRAWIFYLTYYLNSSLSAVFGALFIVYLLSINFIPAQIGLLLGTQRIATIASELPTGIFADKFGRKKSVLLSFFFSAVLAIFWLLSKNFFVLLAASALAGVAFTFQSGAKESLMIQSLKCGQDDKKRNLIFKKMSLWGNVGLLSGGLIAFGLALIQIKLIWVASICLNLLIFFIFLAFVKEGPRIIEKPPRDNKRTTLTKFIHDIKGVLQFFVITFVFGIVVSVFVLSYPIFFKKILGFPDYYFGILGSLSALAGIIGIMMLTRIFDKKGFRYIAYFFVIFMTLLFIAFGIFKPIILIMAAFFLIEGLITGWFPVFQSFFNKFIPEKIRATVLSTNSTISLAAIALGEIAGGFLLKVLKPNSLIALSGIFLLLLIPLLRKIKQQQIKTPLMA